MTGLTPMLGGSAIDRLAAGVAQRMRHHLLHGFSLVAHLAGLRFMMH